MPFPPAPGSGIPDADGSHVGIQSQGSSEVALNQKVKNLIQKLGEAIHESVSESENIAGVVKNLRDQGFDVMLMLEATIGLNQVESEAEEAAESAHDDPLGAFTRNDLTFLKSLRITMPDEGIDELDHDPPTDSADAPSADV
jgi:uncharacterized protein (UPF0335 family)